MRGSATTWQHLITQRGDTLFVGRAREQELFRFNFLYKIPAYLIFAIHGPAGVGKTVLMQQLRAIAEEHEAVTVRVDAAQAAATRQETILQTLLAIARQFAAAGTPLTAFEERYAEYLAARQIVAGDFAAPDGVFGILHNIDEENTVQAEVWHKYLFERFGNRATIDLIKTPVAALTRIFVNDVNAWATVREMLLCFDDWDDTGPHLTAWLQDLLTHHDIRTNVWIAIAGDAPLDETWLPFRTVTATFDVLPFTEDETRTYINAHHITHPGRVSDIVTFSNGLPLLANLLAGATGGTPADLALTPLDRYVKWLDEPWQRDAVLQCAAARHLDADIVSTLIPEPDAETVLAWLARTPGSVQRDGHRYLHAGLRHRLLAFAQQQSPGLVQTAHTRLLATYRGRVADENRPDDAAWRADWREALYHGLMIANGPTIQEGLTIFFDALHTSYARAGEIVQTWQQAADAQLAQNAVTRWMNVLRKLWHALETRDWDETLRLCEAIVRRDDLEHPAQHAVEAFLQTVQARLRPITPEPEEEPEPVAPPEPAASEEPPAAVAEDVLPKAEPAGETEPVAPVEEVETAVDVPPAAEPPAEQPTVPIAPPVAAEIDPDVEAAGYVHRADVYLDMGEDERAIEEYGKAIALDPDLGKAYYHRGLVHAQQQRYAEALIDITRAIDLDPERATVYYNRGLIHARQNDLVQAIADYERAIALAPDDAEVYNSRANAYYKIRDYQRAIADYDLAIRHDPAYAGAYLNRGLAYATVEEYQQAIADYNQAIALNPENAIAYNARGLAYARLQQYARALEDYDRALEYNPQYAIAHNNRGLSLVKLNSHELALAEYRKAVAIDPQYATAHYNAACAAALANDAATACEWLEQAIRLAPRYQSMAQRDPDFDAIRESTAWNAVLSTETTGE